MFLITLAQNMKGLIASETSVSIKFGGSSRDLTEVVCMLFILLGQGTDVRALAVHLQPNS